MKKVESLRNQTQPSVSFSRIAKNLLRCLLLLACPIAGGAAVAADEPAARPATETLSGYLQNWNLDRAARALLEEPSAWSDAKLQLALRVIAQIGRAHV